MNEAEQGALKAVDDYLGAFVTKLRSASSGVFRQRADHASEEIDRLAHA